MSAQPLEPIASSGEPAVPGLAELLFPVLYRNHVELTSLADTKASILTGINGVMISLTIALTRTGIESGWERAALSALLAGCLISGVFSVLAARPRLLRSEAGSPRSPLFFGHYADLTSAAYVERVRDLLADRERLYETMSSDIHALGRVLTRKYRLLRAGYTAFVLAVVVSGVAALAGMLGLPLP